MKHIPLTNGKHAIVDDEDYERLAQFKWHCDTRGYAARSYWICAKKPNKKMGREYMARLVMNNPEGMVVDHINGDTLDNRKTNLRVVSMQQNTWNQKSSIDRGRGISQFKGVTKNGNGPKSWRARIRVDNKLINLGYFASEEEGAKAYNNAAMKYFGEFARLNVV